MTEFLLTHEIAIRGGFFAAALLAMVAWERLAPRRRATAARGGRWSANFGLVVIDTLAVRLLVPLAAVGTALVAQEQGWGLFNAFTLPWGFAFVLSLLVLDLVIYAQHVAFHKVPVLWRLHRVHHSDVDFDTTTAIRFHPAEIVLSMLIKMAIVVALGTPPAAVIVFEVVLNAMALFNHGNVAMPLALDRWLRRAVVTPDMHRVHHSVHRDETDSNFGFNLSIWDRVFGTYCAQPRDGHGAMTIGIDRFREQIDGRLDRLLVQPFRRV